MAAEQRKLCWPTEGGALIVDDEAAVRDTYSTWLGHLGCACHVAGSYAAALDLLERERAIDVVILDHGVRGDDTGAFVAALRDRRPGVVLVGSSGRECRAQFAGLGVDRFLRKPWHPTDLIELISTRIVVCVSCGIPTPLRRPLPGEAGESWQCAFCGALYRAVIDRDAPSGIEGNVRRQTAM